MTAIQIGAVVIVLWALLASSLIIGIVWSRYLFSQREHLGEALIAAGLAVAGTLVLIVFVLMFVEPPSW